MTFDERDQQARVRASGPAEEARGNREVPPAAQPPVRDSGPAEGAGGNREVPPAGPEAPEEDAAEDELTVALRERDEYLDALQRLKAEFDNYRKRTVRDQEALVARASERLVSALLPVLDDLGRALEAAESHEEAKLEEGVRLVQRALADALAREGLLEIATDGKFDPNVHEALLAQPSDGEPGAVLDVVQKGYKLGDRVLRPARVIVAQ
jgi:molecular chaperone GrpE